MTLREATDADLPGLLALYAHLHDEPPLPPGGDTERLWRSLRGHPGLHCIVADAEGFLVSTATLVIVPNLTRGGRPYGLIENVVTHASHRRRGWGGRVLRHALSLAWERGCYKVMLLTSRTDEGVLRFYERAGMVRGVKTGFTARPPGA